MNKIIKDLKDTFNDTPDLIIKEIKLDILNTLYIVYLETVSSSDKVNDYILKTIITESKRNNLNAKNIINFLAAPNVKELSGPDDIEFFLTNGFTIIILNNKIIVAETRADINRSISTTEVETSINGPKDSFTENIQINIGLIKRRIKSSNLKDLDLVIGRKSKTTISILYIDDIANKSKVLEIKKKIAGIDIDAIVDSSSLGFLLDGENNNVYPTFLQTERPDTVATSLLAGKFAIVVDTTPYVLIVPAFFTDFINPNIDNYNKSKNINFIKFLRLTSFFISMIFPALYIALMNYNLETIPTNLLINFAIQRDNVPFPTVIETLIMLFVCEILRESDLRFPSNYGSAISILGAIVLGEASVNAGIASPITIIVIAITFISSLVFTNVEINNALRFFRFIFLIFAAFLGLYGISLALIIFLIYTTNTNSIGYPYFMPIAPFDKIYFSNTVFKTSIKNDLYRSPILSKNRVKQRVKR